MFHQSLFCCNFNWHVTCKLAACLSSTWHASVCSNYYACYYENSQNQFITFQKKTGELEGVVEENFSGLQVIQLFNQQDKQLETFTNLNDSMAKSNFWSQWLSSFIFPSIRFINNLGFVGVLLVAGVINDVISLAPFIFLK